MTTANTLFIENWIKDTFPGIDHLDPVIWPDNIDEGYATIALPDKASFVHVLGNWAYAARGKGRFDPEDGETFDFMYSITDRCYALCKQEIYKSGLVPGSPMYLFVAQTDPFPYKVLAAIRKKLLFLEYKEEAPSLMLYPSTEGDTACAWITLDRSGWRIGVRGSFQRNFIIVGNKLYVSQNAEKFDPSVFAKSPEPFIADEEEMVKQLFRMSMNWYQKLKKPTAGSDGFQTVRRRA